MDPYDSPLRSPIVAPRTHSCIPYSEPVKRKVLRLPCVSGAVDLRRGAWKVEFLGWGLGGLGCLFIFYVYIYICIYIYIYIYIFFFFFLGGGGCFWGLVFWYRV